ncbi:MAG: CDP-6-deoxy-delta-3,4-glucoseen reductase [Gammaproteobacteria bacterium]
MTCTIRLQNDDRVFTAQEDETVLEAALRSGLVLPYGCRNGSCSSCKGKLLSGEVLYRDDTVTGITPEERRAGYALFCQALPRSDLVIATRLVNIAGFPPIHRLPCRVEGLEKCNDSILRLFLKLPSTEPLQFLPGQHIDVLLANNERRSYSLANAPHVRDHLELHVRHYPGGHFSEYAFTGLREKTLLRIEGPLGTFTLCEDSNRPMIMVAGGTGFAPIKSIIEHILHKQPGREVYLYWGARTARDLYLHDLASRWAADHANIRYIPVLSEQKAGTGWNGRSGLVPAAVLEDFPDLSGYEVYTCGPPPMVHAVRDTFVQHGLSSDFIYSDSFESARGV